MENIFSPWQIGSLHLPNRLVRSATWEGMCDDGGMPRQELFTLYSALAKGGVGLIISGYAYVLPRGQGLPNQIGIFNDEHIAPLARLAQIVHADGGKVLMQLVHAGRHTRSQWIKAKPQAPSAGFNQALGEEVEELSQDQIKEIIAAFGDAAARVKAAGFDGVQLHAAHGYLINQFLSPLFNQRDDEFGGSLENRARFCYEIYKSVRQAVGPDFPLLIKLNSDDGLPGGFGPIDAVMVATRLASLGMDAIEVSGGVAGGGKQHNNSPGRMVKGPEDEGYFLANALALKRAVACPIISVGGWRSPERIDNALTEVEAVSLSRPLIREPDLPRRWKAGDLRPARCISCGQCLALGLQGGIACGPERKLAQAS
ncbi:MAG: NADH:flavin oxidoreductase [Pseudomonadota bacterium]